MKNKGNIIGLLTLGLVPFVVTLVQFFKRGGDAPVTQKDLLVLFGIQLAMLTALAIKVFFFSYGIAVIGGQ